MKVISLWQPWASLIILGIKTFETRSWYTGVRGEIGIHASKKIVPYSELFNELPPEQKKYIINKICEAYGAYTNLPTGCILGTGILRNPVPTGKIITQISSIEHACGDYTPGRYAWPLDNVKQFENPVPVKGKQGFWNWNKEN